LIGGNPSLGDHSAAKGDGAKTKADLDIGGKLKSKWRTVVRAIRFGPLTHRRLSQG